MDPRVLDAPWPVRFFVVNATILPTRPRESAHAYSKIWTSEGSPLIVTSRRVQEKLQRQLSVPVVLAMRISKTSATAPSSTVFTLATSPGIRRLVR